MYYSLFLIRPTDIINHQAADCSLIMNHNHNQMYVLKRKAQNDVIIHSCVRMTSDYLWAEFAFRQMSFSTQTPAAALTPHSGTYCELYNLQLETLTPAL